MSPRWTVVFSAQAEGDLQRLYAFLLERDVRAAERALSALEAAVQMLRTFPRSCRRAGGAASGDLRELVVPSGQAGYVVTFQLQPPDLVRVIGVRHQREADYA